MIDFESFYLILACSLFLAIGQGGRPKNDSTVQKIQQSCHTEGEGRCQKAHIENITISNEAKFQAPYIITYHDVQCWVSEPQLTNIYRSSFRGSQSRKGILYSENL